MTTNTRQKIVAGNWKSNGNAQAITAYLEVFNAGLESIGNEVEVLLAPPSVYLANFAKASERLKLAVQNASAQQEGAFTGEVTASMLQDLGVNYALVGHSERRSLFAETDAVVVEKVARLLEQGVRPILCVGETLEQREAGQAEQVVNAQVQAVLSAFDEAKLAELVIAYEPVWAIGTGKTATPEVAQQMHAAIRKGIAATMPILAERCPLLYGGSVNAANASELFSQQDIDGGLVGGASLKAEEFLNICRSMV